MFNRQLIKIDKIQDANVFLFQFTDNKGNTSEERKTIEEFLLTHPLVVEKEKRIQDLEDKYDLLIENKGLLDEKVLDQSKKIEKLKQEKESITKELENFIQEIEGKDLSQTTDLYQEAFALFMKGQLDNALLVFDEAKMKEEERKAQEKNQQLAENRLLKAQILRLKHQYKAAGENYEKVCSLHPDWGNCITTGNYFKFINAFEKAEKYYHFALLKQNSREEKATTLNNLANLHRAKNEFEKA
ncbi:MAG TPA: hypothetical protein DCS93_32575, partial [Microscillaceae bacterium]|nr:hypothetical protein [Microscillaceae bacterium]